ncbi:hypothetical protein HMPREF1326_00180 [Akkermansia sp. KLE1605]|nr:hypothetical protein HMPREF1326_00180 [Akkermansia sp. KLE1605]
MVCRRRWFFCNLTLHFTPEFLVFRKKAGKSLSNCASRIPVRRACTHEWDMRKME